MRTSKSLQSAVYACYGNTLAAEAGFGPLHDTPGHRDDYLQWGVFEANTLEPVSIVGNVWENSGFIVQAAAHNVSIRSNKITQRGDVSGTPSIGVTIKPPDPVWNNRHSSDISIEHNTVVLARHSTDQDKESIGVMVHPGNESIRIVGNIATLASSGGVGWAYGFRFAGADYLSGIANVSYNITLTPVSAFRVVPFHANGTVTASAINDTLSSRNKGGGNVFNTLTLSNGYPTSTADIVPASSTPAWDFVGVRRPTSGTRTAGALQRASVIGTVYNNILTPSDISIADERFANVRVYVDQNNNGYDASDPSALTDEMGRYAIYGVTATASAVVKQVLPTGFSHNWPAAGNSITVSINATEPATANFAVRDQTAPSVV